MKLFRNSLVYGLMVSLLIQGSVFATGSMAPNIWDIKLSEAMNQDWAFKGAVDNLTDLRASLEGFRSQLSEMDSAEKAKHKWKLDENYKEARIEIVKIIQNIDDSSMRIARLLKKLYDYKVQLQSSISELGETKANLELGKQYLSQLLLLTYKMQREIYNESGTQIDDLKVFMKSADISQVLVGNDMLNSLLVQINDLMKAATVQEKEKTALIEKLTSLKNTSQKLLTQYQEEIETLNQKKAYLITFMDLYHKKKLQDLTQKTVATELKQTQDAISALVKDIVSKNYRTENNMADQIAKLNKQKDSSEKETSEAAWPAYPVSQISTVFKDADFEKENGFKNLSVEMSVDQGTPVYAMRDWVVYSVHQGTDQVSWVVIMHTDGYVSAYSYLSNIAVEAGELVKRGQFIGRSGWEPGTAGAGFRSEGANLTFYLFKDGTAIDPLTVLDLSVVMDKDKVLPEEYKLKYFNDQYERPIDVSKVSVFKWGTAEERTQRFLNAYAVGTYRNVDFWDQVVAGTNIDRDMVICIGFAESSLGKFLSTSNNIGNVGNNDRGDRIAYNNPFNWARLIALTLNNQYLGDYHTIKQLSRYGNEDGKIYASSPINWQSNVQKCLSKIKGFYVPEDYPFRTGVNPNRKSDPEARSQASSVVKMQAEKSKIMENSKQTKIGGVKVK